MLATGSSSGSSSSMADFSPGAPRQVPRVRGRGVSPGPTNQSALIWLELPKGHVAGISGRGRLCQVSIYVPKYPSTVLQGAPEGGGSKWIP